MTYRPVRGRRIAAIGLALSVIVVLAVLAYLVFWWHGGASLLGAS